jgi:hypothetical protein
LTAAGNAVEPIKEGWLAAIASTSDISGSELPSRVDALLR